MAAYLARRLALVVPTLLGISLLAFFLANLAPGDPAVVFLERTTDQVPTPAQVVAARHELGLDRPVAVRYVDWVSRALRGDLGVSYSSREPVSTELLARVPATLELAIPAALLSLVAGVAAGAVSALRRNRPLDHAVRVGSLLGASTPSFLLGYILIIVFAVHLAVLPVAGREQPSSLILPVLTLAATPTAILARFTRSAMLEVLAEDYVRTAMAKGVGGARLVVRHVLRNGLIPVVTAFGTSLGYLASGAVIVETVFAWPGAGRLTLDALLARDYPMIQAFVLYAGVTFVLVNLAVDLSYVVLDPRVRLGARS